MVITCFIISTIIFLGAIGGLIWNFYKLDHYIMILHQDNEELWEKHCKKEDMWLNSYNELLKKYKLLSHSPKEIVNHAPSSESMIKIKKIKIEEKAND